LISGGFGMSVWAAENGDIAASRGGEACRLLPRVRPLGETLEKDTQRHVEGYRARYQGRDARLALRFLDPRDCAAAKVAGVGEGLL